MKTTPPEQYFTELRPETLLKWDLVHQKRLAAHFILCFKNCTSKVQTMHCTRPPAELYFTVCFYSKHLRVVLILNCGQVNHIIYSSKLNPSLSITVLCKGAKRSESQSREYWLKDSPTQLHCTKRGKSAIGISVLETNLLEKSTVMLYLRRIRYFIWWTVEMWSNVG